MTEPDALGVQQDKPWNKLKADEKKAQDPERAKKETRKGFIILAVLLVLLGGCVAATSGGDDDTVSANSNTDEDIGPDAPAAEEPAEATNPLDTSDNALACTSARREVGERAEVFEDVGNGTALPADAAQAAQELQADTGDYASFATGDIRTQLAALSDAYGRIRVTITTNDIDGLTSAVAEQTTALNALDTLCTSIGE